ncbi:Beta-lactamase-like protein 2 [Blyttiomyces sp. JEL0837]|nr:Beta-lactamase-like protein 2 [Blyttiomyces sp. JEL0837]
MNGAVDFDLYQLPQLGAIGLPTLVESDHEDDTSDDRLMILTSNKESLAMPTWGINLSYLLELVKACGGRQAFASFTTANICSLLRSWCILEVLACDLGVGRFHVALSPRENERLLKDLQDDFAYAWMLSRVSSERSNTTNDDDRVKIFELIKLVTSFSALDRLVLSTYKVALTKRLEQQLEVKLRGNSTLDILPAQLALITFKMSFNQYQDAKNLSEDAVKRCENELDNDDPLTIKAQLALGLANFRLANNVVAEEIMLDCLGKCLRNPSIVDNHLLTIKTHASLAKLYNNMSDHVKAEEFYNKALAKAEGLLGSADILTLRIKGDLCQLYSNQGDYNKAEALVLETLELASRSLGDNHPETLRLADCLGSFYWEMGKFAEGRDLLIDLSERLRRIVGPHHIDTVKAVAYLGILYDKMGQFEESEPLKLETLEQMRDIYGPEHPNAVSATNNLASLYSRMGKFDKAEPLILRCLEILNKSVGPNHRDTLISSRTLGSLYVSQGRMVEAHTTYLNAWNLSKEHLGLDFGETLRLQGAVAQTYGILGEYDTSESIFIDCIERMEGVFGSDNIDTLAKRRQYGALLNWRGDYEKAVEILSDNLEKSKTFLGEEHYETLACVEVLRCSVNNEHCDSIILVKLVGITSQKLLCLIMVSNAPPKLIDLAPTENEHVSRGHWLQEVIDSKKEEVLTYATDAGEGVAGYQDLLQSVLTKLGVTITDIIITHRHHDHINGIPQVQAIHNNAPDIRIWKRMTDQDLSSKDPYQYIHIENGQAFETEGATLRALYTPGHLDDHVVFYLEEEKAVFSGDSVLGQGTTHFNNLGEYLNSLQQTLDTFPEAQLVYPAHGPHLPNGSQVIKQYIQHRLAREAQIVSVLSGEQSKLDAINDDDTTSAMSSMDIVKVIYASYDSRIWPAADHGVRQHLEKLYDENKVKTVVLSEGEKRWILAKY